MTDDSLSIVRADAEKTPAPRSSSLRGPGVCDAEVIEQGHVVGLVRLPVHRQQEFIDHFNRTYQGIGIRIDAVDRA